MSMERVLEGASADLEQLSPLVRALGSETEATEPLGGTWTPSG